MRKIIHHLRRKPEEERRHILHIVTLVLGIVLILLWTLSLGRNVASKETKEKVKQDLKPFSALKDNLVGGFNSIKDSGQTSE